MDEDDDVVMAMRGGGVQLEEEQRVSVCSSTLMETILYRETHICPNNSPSTVTVQESIDG